MRNPAESDHPADAVSWSLKISSDMHAFMVMIRHRESFVPIGRFRRTSGCLGATTTAGEQVSR